jgi:imidazolonepropionase-like amidohydrolase
VFSPRVQRAIVEEAHKRGIKVDVHSSSAEGHLLAAEAGVDLITHTGLLSQELSDEVVQTLRDRGVICGLFTSWSTGPMRRWLESQASPPAASDSAMVADLRRQVWPNRQRRQLAPLSGVFGGQSTFPLNVKTWRYNDAKLIRGRCTIAVGTDAAPTPWPEITGTGPGVPGFINPDRPFYADPGIGTILAIEGLVELGMTPGEAIVAATAHGALATGKAAELGTIAVGKLADLLVLGADPLADISNIRKLDLIFKDGRAIAPDSLPTRPAYYRR